MKTMLAILGALTMVAVSTGTAAADAVFVGVGSTCFSTGEPTNLRSSDCNGPSGGAVRFVMGYRSDAGYRCYFVDTDNMKAGDCAYPNIRVGIHVQGLLP